jgi:rare lipoprotein A
VVVRINDRGPFKRGRVIDLSHAAAEELGVLHEGLVRVRVSAVGIADADGTCRSA